MRMSIENNDNHRLHPGHWSGLCQASAECSCWRLPAPPRRPSKLRGSRSLQGKMNVTVVSDTRTSRAFASPSHDITTVGSRVGQHENQHTFNGLLDGLTRKQSGLRRCSGVLSGLLCHVLLSQLSPARPLRHADSIAMTFWGRTHRKPAALRKPLCTRSTWSISPGPGLTR